MKITVLYTQNGDYPPINGNFWSICEIWSTHVFEKRLAHKVPEYIREADWLTIPALDEDSIHVPVYALRRQEPDQAGIDVVHQLLLHVPWVHFWPVFVWVKGRNVPSNAQTLVTQASSYVLRCQYKNQDHVAHIVCMYFYGRYGL